MIVTVFNRVHFSVIKIKDTKDYLRGKWKIIPLDKNIWIKEFHQFPRIGNITYENVVEHFNQYGFKVRPLNDNEKIQYL